MFLIDSIWTWDHFLFGITYAVIGSLLFLFLILIFLRPWVKIGKCIASHIDEHGKACFRFKIYNCSLFSGHDVIADLRELVEVPTEPKGKDVYVRKIELTTGKFPYIHRYIPGWFIKNYAHHCIQIKTYEDITEILKNQNKSLQLRVILKHGLTGLSKNFIVDYHTEKRVLIGEFEFGNSLTIK